MEHDGNLGSDRYRQHSFWQVPCFVFVLWLALLPGALLAAEPGNNAQASGNSYIQYTPQGRIYKITSSLPPNVVTSQSTIDTERFPELDYNRNETGNHLIAVSHNYSIAEGRKAYTVGNNVTRIEGDTKFGERTIRETRNEMRKLRSEVRDLKELRDALEIKKNAESSQFTPKKQDPKVIIL